MATQNDSSEVIKKQHIEDTTPVAPSFNDDVASTSTEIAKPSNQSNICEFPNWGTQQTAGMLLHQKNASKSREDELTVTTSSTAATLKQNASVNIASDTDSKTSNSSFSEMGKGVVKAMTSLFDPKVKNKGPVANKEEYKRGREGKLSEDKSKREQEKKNKREKDALKKENERLNREKEKLNREKEKLKRDQEKKIIQDKVEEERLNREREKLIKEKEQLIREKEEFNKQKNEKSLREREVTTKFEWESLQATLRQWIDKDLDLHNLDRFIDVYSDFLDYTCKQHIKSQNIPSKEASKYSNEYKESFNKNFEPIIGEIIDTILTFSQHVNNRITTFSWQSPTDFRQYLDQSIKDVIQQKQLKQDKSMVCINQACEKLITFYIAENDKRKTSTEKVSFESMKTLKEFHHQYFTGNIPSNRPYHPDILFQSHQRLVKILLDLHATTVGNNPSLAREKEDLTLYMSEQFDCILEKNMSAIEKIMNKSDHLIKKYTTRYESRMDAFLRKNVESLEEAKFNLEHKVALNECKNKLQSAFREEICNEEPIDEHFLVLEKRIEKISTVMALEHGVVVGQTNKKNETNSQTDVHNKKTQADVLQSAAGCKDVKTDTGNQSKVYSGQIPVQMDSSTRRVSVSQSQQPPTQMLHKTIELGEKLKIAIENGKGIFRSSRLKNDARDLIEHALNLLRETNIQQHILEREEGILRDIAKIHKINVTI